jgi:sialic acid synthase
MNGTYIIGEIGQNHNGSIDIAKLIIDLVSRPIHEDLFDIELKPIDAIKMTKRDLKEEMSLSQWNKPYNNIHSFGKTYGEHRAVLELDNEKHYEVFKHTKQKGLEFIETICAKGALSLLKLFQPDRLKVASRDLTNLPLLEALSETRIPIILSTGMAGKKELDDAIEVVSKNHSSISILHCVSEYPTRPEHVNLNTIIFLKSNYPNYTIGYSDHTIGISVPVAAVALGAEIIEKHITIDRRIKGTDQINSLGPDGVHRMVRDIRLMERALGEKEIFISESVWQAKNKLERSIASNKLIKKGSIITESDINLLSPGDGYKWSQREKVIGKIAKNDISKNEIIYPSDLE